LFGRGLDDPITLPMRSIEQNTADILVNELERLGQSEDGEGMDKRTLLISYPMELIITCVTPPTGAGKTAQQIVFSPSKFDANDHFGYNDRQRIHVNWSTNDSYCLFYALILARRHREAKILKDLEEKGQPKPANFMNRLAFDRFKENRQRVWNEVVELMKEANIPFGQKAYGIEHLEAVQKCWDSKFDNKFRIFAFQHSPKINVCPIWRDGRFRPYNINIFLKDNHWESIKKVNRFFPCMGRNWCSECESSYGKDVYHKVDCKARCYFCSRVGLGPCPIAKDEFQIECPECHRDFFNEE
jgi:hypothetical protein